MFVKRATTYKKGDMGMFEDAEILEILQPKIQSVLTKTNFQERKDLEQELKLKILSKLPDIDKVNIPNFFELLDKEIPK
jgi:Leu/Phe-tRNA-protein transferase